MFDKLYGNKEYAVSHDDGGATWDEANVACVNSNSTLAVIEAADEGNFLRDSCFEGGYANNSGQSNLASYAVY